MESVRINETKSHCSLECIDPILADTETARQVQHFI